MVHTASDSASKAAPTSTSGAASRTRPKGTGDPVLGLPHSLDAEKAVLSCLLKNPEEFMDRAIQDCRPDSFHSPAHRLLFEILIELRNRNQAIDLVVLTQELINKKILDDVGGAAAVAELLDFVPTTANYDSYAHILDEKRILRSVIECCNGAVQRAHADQEDVGALLDEVEGNILSVRDTEGKDKMRPIKDEVMDAVKKLEQLRSHKGGISGLTTGLADLDRQTDGLHPGEMFIIAARPSMGKTSLVMNIVEHVACNLEQPVMVFSLEMTTQQLVQRLLCARGHVPVQKIKNGMASKQDFLKLTRAASEIAKSKLFLDDTPSISIMELRAKARRYHRQFGLKLIAVDYLQLMRSQSKRGQDNRQIEISEISAGLKALAKELSVPVMVLAQLNRNPEARDGGKPRLSDLRESGSIEQDADVVGLLVRNAYYAKDDAEREERAGEAELIIAKQRNGPTGEVPLVFIDDIMRFGTRAREKDPD